MTRDEAVEAIRHADWAWVEDEDKLRAIVDQLVETAQRKAFEGGILFAYDSLGKTREEIGSVDDAVKAYRQQQDRGASE